MEKESDPRSPSIILEQHAHELRAEGQASDLPQERAVIREQLRRTEQSLRERAYRREVLALLPDLWHSIYGPDPGFVALFSAVRVESDADLTAPRSAYFAWPKETGAAMRWIDREADADRELYQCAHLAERDMALGWRKYCDRPDAVRRYHAILDYLEQTDPPHT